MAGAWFEWVAEAHRRAKRRPVLTRLRWLASWAKTGRDPLGLGKNSIHELGPADLLVPEGFQRRLGVAGELVN